MYSGGGSRKEPHTCTHNLSYCLAADVTSQNFCLVVVYLSCVPTSAQWTGCGLNDVHSMGNKVYSYKCALGGRSSTSCQFTVMQSVLQSAVQIVSSNYRTSE